MSAKAGETTDVQSHAWRSSGGTEECAGAVTHYSCHAALAYEPDRDGKAMLSGDSFKQGKRLALLVEPVSQWRIRNPSGNPCNRNNAGERGLLPASGSGYMPKMVTPQVEVAVAKLRNLNVGDDLKIDVSSGRDAINDSHPPHHCEAISASDLCTESLTWHGIVRVMRLR